MESPHAPHVVVPGVHSLRTLARRTLLLDLSQLGLDRADYTIGNLVLHGKGIREVAVVALTPQMGAGRRLDELCGDPYAVTRLAHTTLEHIAYAQISPNLLDVDSFPLVDEAGVARDYEEPAPFRQCRNDVFADAVGEVFLLDIATHVREWQNGDRRPVRQRRRDRRAIERCARRLRLFPAHAIGAHRPRDVLDFLFAEVPTGERDLAFDLLPYGPGDEDAAGLGHLLEPRRDVDAIAQDVCPLYHDIAHVDTDPEMHPARLFQVAVSPIERSLNRHRCAHGLHRASEFS